MPRAVASRRVAPPHYKSVLANCNEPEPVTLQVVRISANIATKEILI
jgi:hypothetical protein